MNAVMTGPGEPAVASRCRLDEVFAHPFIELIGLAPRNPVVRGLILAQTGRMPGTERETFEQIKEWVETTCAPCAGGGRPTNGGRAPSRNGIGITVEISETEYGRANYSVDRSGSKELAFDEDELLAIIQEVIADGKPLAAVIDQGLAPRPA